MAAHHTIETPRSTPGAIGMIRLTHPDPGALGLMDPAQGRIVLSDLLGLDEGVIARFDADSVMLMPHGGVGIIRAISEKLSERGAPLAESDDPLAAYPEAGNEIEAWMLCAIARAPSPAALDVLLDQPGRWRALGVETIEGAARIDDVAPGKLLDRLLHPPIVAAIGGANVGKSTLVNALVGRRIALVADAAGTTRDHVGVGVELGGLVVRWIDTPGIDPRVGAQIRAGDEIEIAIRVVSRADLIVHCIDPGDASGALDPRLAAAVAPGVPIIRLGTRSDLGAHTSGVDLAVSIPGDGEPRGIGALVGRISGELVPPGVLDDPRPWRFWASFSAGGR